MTPTEAAWLIGGLIALGHVVRPLKRWLTAKQEGYRAEVIAEEIRFRDEHRPKRHIAGADWQPTDMDGEEAYLNPATGELLVPGKNSV